MTESADERDLATDGQDGTELLADWQVNPVFRAASSVVPTLTISDEQVAAYHRDGYLALPEFTNADDLAAIGAIYDDLFDDTGGRGDLDLVTTDSDTAPAIPQILGPAMKRPELIATTLAAANARALATRLLGPGATLEFDHAISKPPHSDAETPWHQDEAYWHPQLDYRSMSIWIALQDVDDRNGCMRFVPGSHAQPVLPHQHIGVDRAAHGLEIIPGSADTGSAVSCPLPAGGATVHDSRTLHFTSGNVTDSTRRAYILVASTPPRRMPEPRDFAWAR